ncbi:TPA: hypothetical protein ACXJNB_001641 [Serratia marcescens]
MKKRHMACLLYILMGIAGYANANSTIQALANCDASFFKEIQHDGNLKSLTSSLDIFMLKTTGELSFPTTFTSPEGIEVNNFIVTYTDFDKYKEISTLDVKGQFYYWGFESLQSFNEVVEILSQKINLVKSGNIYTYNPMIRNTIDGQWMANNAAVDGVAPEENSAEKLFIIEDNKEKGVVSITCTLQGKITDKDLYLTGLLRK